MQQDIIERAQYVARMWKRADETDPTGEMSPADSGWRLNRDCYELDWFHGRSSVPESLTHSHSHPQQKMIMKLHLLMKISQTILGVMMVMTRVM